MHFAVLVDCSNVDVLTMSSVIINQDTFLIAKIFMKYIFCLVLLHERTLLAEKIKSKIQI